MGINNNKKRFKLIEVYIVFKMHNFVFKHQVIIKEETCRTP